MGVASFPLWPSTTPQYQGVAVLHSVDLDVIDVPPESILTHESINLLRAGLAVPILTMPSQL
jgi:hypothetical protein